MDTGMKRFFWLSLLLSALFDSTATLAQDESFVDTLQLRAGMVGSISFGGEHTLGLEASLPWFRRIRAGSSQWDGFGPVIQWQRLHEHDRIMLGLEYVTSSMFGFELGWARWETEHGPVQGVHATPFVSLGIVSAGPRIFLAPTAADRGFEIALNLYFKFRVFGDAPLRWYGG